MPGTCKALRRRSFIFLFVQIAIIQIPASMYTEESPGKLAQRKVFGGLQPFTEEQLADFLSERRKAAIATLNTKGDPQLTPVIFYWDGSAFSFTVTKET
jgi:hypothetical protein